ncbi:MULTISPECIES: hypothetical protein [Actinoallomurus]|nr:MULTISPECIES: hypothetical protein [Actinoallomurus]MCO5969204.1 hypothetical protein [Actinoallomurus soli]MCO5998717.1 hypothetical protein [Actinoallomurus rhizosphaericola]
MVTLTLDPIGDLFTDTPEWEVPPVEDRFAYKKKAGSSDSYNTKDEIET